MGRSLLNISIQVDAPFTYAIAMNTVRGERTWPMEQVPRLRLLGEIFAGVLNEAHRDGT